MASLLRSISLTNFRSIRGTISVPLDASIVLIHGQNGAGKTSLLSGIELALTGGVPSLKRLDEHYFTHLVHKEADSASVTVTVNAEKGEVTKTLKIKDEIVTGKALFTQSDAAFCSERCFLAQSTMNRLLELYQGKESKKGDSALTKFVKDLLGLDHLDALIAGLHSSGNVTRLKNAIAQYRSAIERLPDLKQQVAFFKSQSNDLNKRLKSLEIELETRAASFQVPAELRMSLPHLTEIGHDPQDQTELQRLAQVRREIIAAQSQWNGIQQALTIAGISDAERTSSQTSEALERWRKDGGEQINRTIARVRLLLSDVPDPSIVGASRAVIGSREFVSKELRRYNELLKKDADATSQISTIDEQLRRAQARLTVLDEQIAGHLENADRLAQALTSLLPMVEGDQCPVCGRNFSEVSSEHLQSHLSQKISSLVESAGRLQGFVRERSGALKEQADGLRRREALAGSQLDGVERTRLSLGQAELEELNRELATLQTVALDGERLIEAVSVASRALSELRGKSEQAVGFRAGLKSFEELLGLAAIPDSEETSAALVRFLEVLNQKQEHRLRNQESRKQMLVDVDSFSRARIQRSEIDTTLTALEEEQRVLNLELEAFQSKMLQARELAKIAKGIRSNIVRSVFSDSLNALWRELFIRLAPNEFFVPAFALPDKDDGIVEAVLETHYRDGGRGGNPRAMLSAGNLNTAALTLFLALHLSVEKKFPCLIIDDPVQSMDEVHIAQFAALLRTLSRQHDRQIVVAVHEKPLFDYLALELTPAFPGERLITIELGSSSEGQTFERHKVISYEPDSAFAAA